MNNTYIFSRHALARVQRGDANGLRTRITFAEILEVLTKRPEILVPWKVVSDDTRQGLIFYSQKDADCIGLIVHTTDRPHQYTIVTVMSGAYICDSYGAFPECLLAIKKALGGDVLVQDTLPRARSCTREDSARLAFRVSYWYVSGGEMIKSRLMQETTTWLDYTPALFQHPYFLEHIINMGTVVQDRVSHYEAHIRFFFRGERRGEKWKTQYFPLSLPYELLGRTLPARASSHEIRAVVAEGVY